MGCKRKEIVAVILSAVLLLSAGCSDVKNGQEIPNPGESEGVMMTPSGTDSSSEPSESPRAENSGGALPSSSSSPQQATPNPDSNKATSPPSSDSQQAMMSPVTAVRLIDPSSGWSGGKGWISRTEDGGKSWTVQYKGQQTVKQLFALNGQEAWAVLGEDSEAAADRPLLHTTDGGREWAPAGKVPIGEFLHFVSSQEAFIGNQHTTDGGKTWTALPVPESIVGEAYYHDAANGWAVTQGDQSFQIQRTTDGGVNWQNVMSGKTAGPLNGSIIRSAGAGDAWVELIGDSGMTQTSYSLFHTTDGGENWLTVLANSTAGGGPAPGFPDNDSQAPSNTGSRPGPLYVVNPKIAFMGGQCPACDNPNTIGWTKDGGKSWENGEAEFPGYGNALLAAADADHVWWIITDSIEPSIMYTTSDGGKHWNKAHTFDPPAEN
ncbi:hypothetical protein [Paenibacillus sp. J2TS4]|uniref:hypothetical protein n=1 Tax=Paenibacillus sp. J2TS4 TaxID=2807194 RepID=UPI001B2C8768|nr:hypothetical protein [Paenibacillus sp. J2TS4]GIP32205.1 hypothetical protein J2TS4_14150 [Paenibacillus sp. J2TS4]